MQALGRLGPDPIHKKAMFGQANYPDKPLVENISYSMEFGPVLNQEKAPCCVAFATSQLHELKLRKHANTNIQISQRALYSMTKHLYEDDHLTEEGLYTVDALITLSNNGYVLESDWPYGNADDTSILQLVPGTLVKKDHNLTGYVSVAKEDMQRALVSHGPLVIGTSWPYDWFQPIYDAQGMAWLNPHPMQGIAGGHDLLIVGYSTTKKHDWGQGAYLLRNQWGETWGNRNELRGYAWLPFVSEVLPDDIYTIQL